MTPNRQRIEMKNAEDYPARRSYTRIPAPSQQIWHACVKTERERERWRGGKNRQSENDVAKSLERCWENDELRFFFFFSYLKIIRNRGKFLDRFFSYKRRRIIYHLTTAAAAAAEHNNDVVKSRFAVIFINLNTSQHHIRERWSGAGEIHK